MRFIVDGSEVYASTGGRDPVEGQDWLLFLHGAGASHLVWSQQSRSFAYGGYNVLAVDLPGHNLSAGEPLVGIGAQAAWVVKVMDHLNIGAATFIGHSQGGLITLAVSDIAPDRVKSLVFIATAASIPVHAGLIGLSENAQSKAKSAMTSNGLGPDAHHGDNSVPGVNLVASGLRVMDMNEEVALPRDLHACNDYAGGIEVAAKVPCPSLCILAEKDRMTPLKFGRKLADALPDNTLHVMAGAGHTLPTERPSEVNAALREFLGRYT